MWAHKAGRVSRIFIAEGPGKATQVRELPLDASVVILRRRGYAVLYFNPRGSNGYGEAFSDGCVNDWGGGDYKDLMAGLDLVLAEHPELDGKRLGQERHTAGLPIGRVEGDGRPVRPLFRR